LRRPSFVPTWLIPQALRATGLLRARRKITNHLLKDYGWVQSFRAGKCLDRDGEPIPWFTYPSIDFLSQLDLSEKAVFEYGSGASTLFWAKRVRSIVSVESVPEWHTLVSRQVPTNAEVVLVPADIDSYAGSIHGRGQFDIIVVDGLGDSRPLCCELALTHVRPGGVVILDNSDQWLKSAAVLRHGGLIQADFTGFSPLNSGAGCTSVFFTRDYNFQPRNGYQPHASVAQPLKPWPEG